MENIHSRIARENYLEKYTKIVNTTNKDNLIVSFWNEQNNTRINYTSKNRLNTINNYNENVLERKVKLKQLLEQEKLNYQLILKKFKI